MKQADEQILVENVLEAFRRLSYEHRASIFKKVGQARR